VSAVPSFGRAARVEPQEAAGADTTRDLFERFSAQIFGYCLHQLGSREEAEDAVQTTFMNAFRGLKRGIVPTVESAWLFKIAHNVCLSRRRSSFRRGRVEAPNNLEVLQEVVPAREQSGEELIRLQDVLERMAESQRRAILLREWQGLSYREIADELELSQSAVETLIFRARRALAAGLEEEPSPEPRSRWQRRARHGADAGGLFTALKALFTGGGAVKVAATVAAVATSTVVAASAGHHGTRVAHAPASLPAASTSAVSDAPMTSVAAFGALAHPVVASGTTRPKHRVAGSRKPTAVSVLVVSEGEDAAPTLPSAASGHEIQGAPSAKEERKLASSNARPQQTHATSKGAGHDKPNHDPPGQVAKTAPPSPGGAASDHQQQTDGAKDHGGGPPATPGKGPGK
jgi:RNA polymerase sigma factor (sigma-70 family)